MDFIYWRHITPTGIKVEEVSGGDGHSEAVQRAMARQIYCENGRDGEYRSLLHLPSGAPLLENEETRISITHTPGLYAVASLPRTPEADLTAFDERTALGIDAERADRDQVMRIRERFLSPEELELTGTDLERTLIAWTAKEALYKAAMTPGLDWRTQLQITSLPALHDPEAQPATKPATGTACLNLPDRSIAMELYAYRSADFIVTLAYSPRCAKYKGSR